MLLSKAPFSYIIPIHRVKYNSSQFKKFAHTTKTEKSNSSVSAAMISPPGDFAANYRQFATASCSPRTAYTRRSRFFHSSVDLRVDCFESLSERERDLFTEYRWKFKSARENLFSFSLFLSRFTSKFFCPYYFFIDIQFSFGLTNKRPPLVYAGFS